MEVTRNVVTGVQNLEVKRNAVTIGFADNLVLIVGAVNKALVENANTCLAKCLDETVNAPHRP